LNTVLSVFGLESLRISGIEIHARELSRQLGECGWHSVICFHNSVPEAVRNYFDLPNISLEVVPRPWDVSPETARALQRVMRTYNPQILHLHYTGFLTPYPWLGHLCGVEKIFLTDHTSQPEGFAPRLAPRWKRSIARAIHWPLTNVICVSDYGYRSNIGMGLLPRERFCRIYNGVDLDQAIDPMQGLCFKREFGIPQDHKVVTQLSWMIPEKGIADLLEAARIVVAVYPDAHFVLAGEGAHRTEFMRRAETLELNGRVTWVGNISDPIGRGVYAASDIVCQMSRWEEVFGFVIAEAMAAGKPVVATRVGGIPELVEDGVTGFLVERKDHVAMAQSILRLLKDGALRQQMGRAGRRLAEKLFDLRKNVAELIRRYGFADQTISAGSTLLGAGASCARSSTGAAPF
jgi:glycosyltransferase involved in cell wall biosynthesis